MSAAGPESLSGDTFGWVGATLNGKYRIDAVIGEGGFGVVYKAHHLGFEETVAVKCLRIPPGLQGEDRDRFFASFMEEGRLLHRLSRSSAGIVQALDVGGAESPSGKWTPYIVLEWLDGRTLEADLEEREVRRLGGRPLAEALEILDPAARALALVHEQGIAHRDIKPANLFLAEVGGRRTLKILDFGIAKVLTETASLTRAFEATGMSLQAFSPRYGAPEQFSRRFGATGPWTDVFAFALVLVEVTSGRTALDGEDAAQLFVSAVDPARRPTLRNCGVDLGDAIEGVLSVALAIEPKDRYVSATEFWEALLGAAQASGVTLPASATRGLMPSVVSVDALGPTAPPSSRPQLESRARIPGALAATQLAATTTSRRSVTPDTKPTLARIALAALASTTVFALAAGLGVLLMGGDREKAETGARTAAVGDPPASPSASVGSGARTASPQRIERAAEQTAGEPSLLLSGFSVPPGRAAEKAPWFPEFRVDPGPADTHATFRSALATCEKKSLSLCTEPQWERACVSERGLAARVSWTLSAATDGFAVRGGATCGDRRLVAGSAQGSSGVLPSAVCCERAVGIATTNYLSSFLAATATRLLAVESAFNSHDAERFGDLLADKVGVNGRYQSRSSVEQSILKLFGEHPDQKMAIGTCKVAMHQVAAPKKRSRRRKPPPPPAPTWTSECEQLRYRTNEAAVIVTNYAFTGSGKLKSTTDTATQREWTAL